ncbi:hypothetical protein Angca_009927, partial [Angiostrongylus cantonensis]
MPARATGRLRGTSPGKVSAQAEVNADTIADFVRTHSYRGHSHIYAEHDMLMKTEKHITRYNQFSTKNRCPSVVCYDENAVELKPNSKKEEKLDRENTYINANIVNSPQGNFILAQAPMANTLIEWYRMIWQLKISIVVCLIDPQEIPPSERYFALKEGNKLKRYNKNPMAKESDDDFCSPNPPRSLLAAPRRPEKKGDVQSVPVISIQSSSMCLEPLEYKADSTQESSGKFDTCAICSKNISHLDNLRKCAHVNRCLDTQESSNAYEKAKDKWNNVVDCPMCGEPQPPGPVTHAKRCGKAYNITPKELLKLMETQQRICNAKKHHNMVHTKL